MLRLSFFLDLIEKENVYGDVKMKTMLLILILIILSAGMLTAQTAIAPASGDGTSGDPYQIATLNNLYWITQNSDEWNKYYVQTTDIDASSTSGWDSGAGFLPIGNSSTKFTGSYDGQNFTISGLTINRSGTNNIGLFGYTNGSTIQDLGMTSAVISGNNYVGSFVGYNSGSSTVSNCYNTGTVTGSNDYVGGLVGWNDASTVSNSCNSGSVTCDDYAGGLVGSNRTSSTVSNCYSTGSVSGQDYVGGLVAHAYSSEVSNCYSTGSVSGGAFYVGGLVGGNYSSPVTNSFWDTETSGQDFSGGGTGKTTVEMKNVATFSDEATVGLTTAWDFETNPNDDSENNDYFFAC
jgi:hypothetical protein